MLATPQSPAGSGLSAVRRLNEGTVEGQVVDDEADLTQLKLKAQTVLESLFFNHEDVKPGFADLFPAMTPMGRKVSDRSASMGKTMSDRSSSSARDEHHEDVKPGFADLFPAMTPMGRKVSDRSASMGKTMSERSSASMDKTMSERPSTSARDERVRMECYRCGYKCVPQWLNDEAHCLKCQAVLKTQPSVHERGVRPSPTRMRNRRATTPAKTNSENAIARSSDGRQQVTDENGLYQATLLSKVSGNSGRSNNRRANTPARSDDQGANARKIVGPERFFYDKSSYTGTHANGGPSSVSKGDGTGVNMSWKRPV